MMERHEMEAWLGDNHGLNNNQITELIDTAAELAKNYPGDGQAQEREEVLTAVYRLMVEPAEDVVRDLAIDLTMARMAAARAGVALQYAAKYCIHDNARGIHSEAGFAIRAGVDRMTVRNWIGK